MTIDDPKMFNVIDPHPNMELDDIESAPTRAHAAYARNKDKISGDHQRIMGAIFMLSGLEYHHYNFVTLCGEVVVDAPLNERNHTAVGQAKHECLAYLNRMYQFKVFSEYAHREKGTRRLRPASRELIKKFRHEYAGKRRLDMTSRNPIDPGERYRLLNLENNFTGITGFNARGHIIIATWDNANKRPITFDLARMHISIISNMYDVVHEFILASVVGD